LPHAVDLVSVIYLSKPDLGNIKKNVTPGKLEHKSINMPSIDAFPFWETLPSNVLY
jgi:hypothetical protein